MLFDHALPQVCILVLNHNGMQYIDRCLESFLATDSSVVDYEILLVDNASSDGSLQHVKRRYANHPKIRLVPLDQNYGFGPAFMKGLELASPDAEYLAFSNIDLFVDPGWLNEIIKVLDADVVDKHCESYTGVLDSCVHKGDCGIRPVIIGLHEIVENALSQITLAQLVGTESVVDAMFHQIQGIHKTLGSVVSSQ